MLVALLQVIAVAVPWIVVPVAAWLICGPLVDAIPNAISWVLDQFQKEDDDR